MWSESLGLYLGLQAEMLRYFTEAGELVLSPAEQAGLSERQVQQAQQEAAQAQQQAQQAVARAALLGEQLRALGIEPEG